MDILDFNRIFVPTMKRTIGIIGAVIMAMAATGQTFESYAIKNDKGMEASVTNYGARLVSLVFKGTDVVLGFDDLEDYHRHKQNFGAVVGRYVGRINHAQFTLDGETFKLQENGKGVTSHGGYPAFADRFWTQDSMSDSTLTLKYISADGENGFPGELTVRVTYRLTHDNTLRIDYEATTTRPTVINLTNHSFFNLSGNHAKPITAERMWIFSDSIATFDKNKNLDGRFMRVDGTPFDFRQPHLVGERLYDYDEQLSITGGYDHSFALPETDGTAPIAWIEDDDTNIRMTVYTTEPALHVYAGNGLKGNMRGKGGTMYPRRSGICFETMHYADSPNQPHFPTTVLRPGTTFRSHTIFKFERK